LNWTVGPTLIKGETMKSFLSIVSITVLAFAMMACAKEGTDQATATTAEPAKAAAAEATPAGAPKPAATAAKPDVVKPAVPAAPAMVKVPQGTAITVVLTDPISTANNKAGDTFTGSLAAPLVVNGETVASKGATVKGKVIDAEDSGRVKGVAHISLALTSVVADGKSYAITTRPFVAEAEPTKKRDAGVIAGGSGVGAAIGAIAGGGKGAVKGAIIGGAAGTGAVLATKGKEVEFDSETKLTFELDKAAELPKAR
jgi:hypothetical protein